MGFFGGGGGGGSGLGAARALEHREAVLDRRGLRVEVLVRRPLLAPALLPRVEKGARVRLLEDLRLRIDVLVGPARGHDVVRHGCAELAVRVLAPQVLGRGLVAVEPLAGALDLAGLGAALDADARLDAHDLGVRLHLVGHGREVRHGLLGGGGREALALVLAGLAREGDLLVGVGGVGPRVEGLVREDEPELALLADPLAVLEGGEGGAAEAGDAVLVEAPHNVVLGGAVENEGGGHLGGALGGFGLSFALDPY